MNANKESAPNTADVGIDEWRKRCVEELDLLSELRKVHLLIDKPTREVGNNEPQWIFRLRKIGLHVSAVIGWEICADMEHVMASELRAAYEQMDRVWREIPDSYRLAIEDGWWANEAKNSLLATYDHPTPQSLMLSVGHGGFIRGEDRHSYACLACWLFRLESGYGSALVYLATVLGAEGDVLGRLTALVRLTSAFQNLPLDSERLR